MLDEERTTGQQTPIKDPRDARRHISCKHSNPACDACLTTRAYVREKRVGWLMEKGGHGKYIKDAPF